MTWETYTPANRRLRQGEASVQADGKIRLRLEDLRKAGVEGPRVLVELDREGRRLAVREGDGEGNLLGETDSKSTVLLYAEPMLRRMGIDPGDVVGRCACVSDNEGRLIVLLPGAGKPQKARRLSEVKGNST